MHRSKISSVQNGRRSGIHATSLDYSATSSINLTIEGRTEKKCNAVFLCNARLNVIRFLFRKIFNFKL